MTLILNYDDATILPNPKFLPNSKNVTPLNNEQELMSQGFEKVPILEIAFVIIKWMIHVISKLVILFGQR